MSDPNLSVEQREREHLETLEGIARSARCWEPDACLLGNLRAKDIAAACEYARRALAPTTPEQGD